MAQQRRARRGAELALDRATVNGNARKQKRRRGSRDRENTVGAFDLPAPDMDARRIDLLRRKQVHQQTYAHHVCQRV